MRARDIMTTDVISVSPGSSVRSVARTMLRNRISAVPVLDDDQNLVGIVSEDDLLQRPEIGAKRAPWWRGLLDCPETQALEYVKSQGRRAQDVMTPAVVTIDEDTSVSRIAELLEQERIKRVPVMRGGRVVGIVSRADLLRTIVTLPRGQAVSGDDGIRLAVLARFRDYLGLSDRELKVTVSNGVVHLWGSVPLPKQNLQRTLLRGLYVG